MKTALPADDLAGYVAQQLSAFFPDRALGASAITPCVKDTLDRVEKCFGRHRAALYFDGQHALFDPLVTDQYAIFLYFLGNMIHRRGGDPRIATKVYALNKALHGLDIFYESRDHPISGVCSTPWEALSDRRRCRATCSSINAARSGRALEQSILSLPKGVVLFGDTAVVGRTGSGPNTWVALGTRIVNTRVAGGFTVFGRSPSPVLKATPRSVVSHFFR